MKRNFQKNDVVTSKTVFFVTGPFCTHHLFVLILANHMTVLYGNNTFQS